MTIAKQQVFELIKDLPEEVDVDEIMYRLYLRQKLETAEKDVRKGRIISHEEVVRRLLNGSENKVDSTST